MQIDRIILNYQREDDILYVTFGQEGRKGVGLNLHANILLRFDRSSGEPLGLTFIDYSKLKTQTTIPLNDFSSTPEELQKPFAKFFWQSRYAGLSKLTHTRFATWR